MIRQVGAGLSMLILAGGCPLTGPGDNTETDTRGVERPMPDRIEPDAGAPHGTPAAAVPEELMTRIRADLAGRTGADDADIRVQHAEAVVWNDGSLGCPEPGTMYTQALVEGYWVVLGYDGKSWDYRATRRGHFRLCRGGGRPPAGREPLL